MVCPKCEIGNIETIILKATGETASLCDYCKMVWFKSEEIRFNTGHPFESIRKGENHEYTVEELGDKDQEHRPKDSTIK